MRIATASLIRLAALLLTACGSSAPSDYGDEALAEAERANSRADDLESQVADMEQRLNDLESQLASEVSEREYADAELERELGAHEHY